jgi:hypothetical protein
VAATYGVEGDDDGWLTSYGHTIGSAWGDFDNDGYLDLFVGNFAHEDAWQDRSKFYRNLGPDGGFHFEDKSGVAGLQYQETYSSPCLGDYDNDGYLDLFFATINSTGTFPDRSVLYRNEGNWTFTDVTAVAGIDSHHTYQAAWADFDNDGDLDLITAGSLYRNRGNSNHWLKIRVEGDGVSVNRSAIGTQVRVYAGSEIMTRQVEGATGEGNQNDLTLHFGLGSHSGQVEVEILWPDGSVDWVTASVDKLLTITLPVLFAPDFDNDGDVDQVDFGHYLGCITGPASGPPATGCEDADLDGDNDVDQEDFGLLQRCYSGPDLPVDVTCAGTS